ncbi:MAG: hypothetical protein ACRD2C_20605 [Acidimicrobiales bacterium]
MTSQDRRQPKPVRRASTFRTGSPPDHPRRWQMALLTENKGPSDDIARMMTRFSLGHLGFRDQAELWGSLPTPLRDRTGRAIGKLERAWRQPRRRFLNVPSPHGGDTLPDDHTPPPQVGRHRRAMNAEPGSQLGGVRSKSAS